MSDVTKVLKIYQLRVKARFKNSNEMVELVSPPTENEDSIGDLAEYVFEMFEEGEYLKFEEPENVFTMINMSDVNVISVAIETYEYGS
jgi:hypothetical protein